jgi:hypothetical protein
MIGCSLAEVRYVLDGRDFWNNGKQDVCDMSDVQDFKKSLNEVCDVTDSYRIRDNFDFFAILNSSDVLCILSDKFILLKYWKFGIFLKILLSRLPQKILSRKGLSVKNWSVLLVLTLPNLNTGTGSRSEMLKNFRILVRILIQATKSALKHRVQQSTVHPHILYSYQTGCNSHFSLSGVRTTHSMIIPVV